jgi:myxalamid-type polyketide synthase MxaE and MxaD
MIMRTQLTDLDDPIAVVGIACRFPGANGPEEFWQLLCGGRCAIGSVPADRFDIEALYDPTPATPGKVMSRWGGFLPDIQMFDTTCFGISPREAAFLDPQQRLLLKIAWEALEDAGQPIDDLAGTDTGVFVGLWLNDYEARLFGATPETEFYMTTGTGRYAASGRISYCFGLEGPSLTIDTACSSSLVAVHLACQSLRTGDCSMAIAGGANIILQPHVTVAYSQSRMMAPDGRCKFGDAQADGYVRSEGAGVVVLKPLKKAITDRNPIYAVIRGSAITNDGKSSGSLGTPSRSGQERLLRRAYENAGLSPGSVQYVESHGTGTSAGDPVELGALGTVLATGRTSPCLVGSVKTNLGHTEGAAGLAGLIKVALSLHYRAIPPSLHYQQPNPNIPWAELPLNVVRELTAWPSEPGAGIGSVSAFGIAGTNAHVVLGEAPQPNSKTATDGHSRAVLLPISARSWKSARNLAGAYASWLGSGQVSLRDVTYTASRRRSHHACRLAVVGETTSELKQQLETWLASEAGTEGMIGQKIVFVFPGQGSQWLGMGRELMQREPVFRETLAQCDSALRPFVDWSLLEQLQSDETSPSYHLSEIDCIQPTLLAIEIALAELWRSWGIKADAVIGHSMGEVAAAFIAGALTLDDAMRVISCRSKLLRRTSGQGAMAIVELSTEETEAVLTGLQDRLSIAVSNSPTSTVISGNPAAIEQVLQNLEERGVFCRPVRVDVASHSPQMDQLQPELLAALSDVLPTKAAIPIYSTCQARILNGTECDARYWADNLRRPVLFSQMTQKLLAADYGVFIEMSPHPVLLPAIEQGFQHSSRAGAAIPSLRRKEPEQQTILTSLGKLYELGYSPDWEQLNPAGDFVKLPRYSWDEERFWCDSNPAPAYPVPSNGRTVLQFQLGNEPLASHSEVRDVVQQLRSTAAGEKRNDVMKDYLCSEVAKVLRSSPARINHKQPFKTVGLDSLMTLELRNRLERTLGFKLSPTMLFNYPTVVALAPRLLEKMSFDLEEPKQPIVTEIRLPTVNTNLDSLSKDELEDLLAKELACADDLLRAEE